MSTRTAFGGMLRDIVALDSMVLRPEPLDTEIERRCKQASVDYMGLEEASAWKECGTYPSRQPDR